MIYFIQEKGNPRAPIKIGYSNRASPRFRLREVQNGYPYGKLWVIAAKPGTMENEGQEHARWDSLRLQGEWFASSKELLAYIDRLGALNRCAKCVVSVVLLPGSVCEDCASEALALRAAVLRTGEK